LGLAAPQPAAQAVVSDAVMALVEQRQAARAAKRWAEADALRAQIRALGYEVEDTAAGPVVKRRTEDGR